MGLRWNYSDGQTPIDEDEKTGLKIKFISTLSELNAFEQKNIERAIAWTLGQSLSSNDVLSETFIHLVHKKMFGEVWRWAGTFRSSDKNIGVPYYQIIQQLRILIDDCKFWIQNQTFSPPEIAIRFKHGLVAIHLYPNGNRRHSRLIGDLLMQSLAGEVFSWGSRTISPGQVRRIYIESLREADAGDFTKLIAFSQQ